MTRNGGPSERLPIPLLLLLSSSHSMSSYKRPAYAWTEGRRRGRNKGIIYIEGKKERGRDEGEAAAEADKGGRERRKRGDKSARREKNDSNLSLSLPLYPLSYCLPSFPANDAPGQLERRGGERKRCRGGASLCLGSHPRSLRTQLRSSLMLLLIPIRSSSRD